jgi:hypothetical protein
LLTNPEAIQEGNIKVILGLLYTIVYRYIIIEKSDLISRLTELMAPFQIEVGQNLLKSVQDGTLFCALVNIRRPNTLDMSALDKVIKYIKFVI